MMSDTIPEIAELILNGISSAGSSDAATERDEFVLMEATRIAALEWTLGLRLRGQSPTQASFFAELTHHASVMHTREDEVRSFVSELLEASTAPMPDLSQQVTALSDREFADLLATVHLLGSQLHPSEGRRQKAMRPLGTFYTPPKIIDHIVDIALGPSLTEAAPSLMKGDLSSLDRVLSLTVLDPACGPGGFLVSSYMRLRSLLERTNFDDVEQMLRDRFLKNLYGVDLDAAALEVTKVVLGLIAGVPYDQIRGLDLNLRQGNALISRFGLEGTADYSHLIAPEDGWSSFEWREEFPEVFKKTSPGFDVIVMNPPYERLKPNFAEFLRERLVKGDRKIHTKEYVLHRERLSRLVTYFRRCADYRLTNRYTMDTHRLFIERALSLLRHEGHLGIIVPTSILGDLSSQPLRRSLLFENSLADVLEFPEAARIFPGVTQGVTILHVIRGHPSEVITISSGLTGLSSENGNFPLRVSIADIERVMGHSAKIPLVDPKTWRVMVQIHSHPRLAEYHQILNLRGELDLTMDREFITDTDTGIPLIRGSQIQRFRLTRPQRRRPEYVVINGFTASRSNSRRMKHIDTMRIACQQISNRAQRWRLKFALVEPPCVLANSCNYLVPLREDRRVLLYLLGVLNSSLLNLRFKIGSTNNHVSNREIGDLPLVDPFSSGKDTAAVISAITDTVEEILDSVNNEAPLHRLDALVFRLYEVSAEDAKSVLRSLGADKREVSEVIQHL